MRLIQLTKIERPRYDEDTGTDVEGSTPCQINADAVRCFYPRHDDKPGTRITFTDGGGFAVRETPEAVAAALALQ